ncbi:MAG: Uma2 family endonuclease [Calditrichaeota bacterium]|nr:Uma2 family endonuclease [Calditrichota bacterium]
MKARELITPYTALKRKFTYLDYLRLPEDGNRYELIKGELIMVASPNTFHQTVKANIEYELRTFVRKHKNGTVLDAPIDVVLSKENVVQPDILFISAEHSEIITQNNISGAPDFIIEIISPSTAYYDMFEKKDLYEYFGVKEYWIVDPIRRWVETYGLRDKKYELLRRQENDGTIQSAVLKGFEIDFKTIFSE